MSSDSSTTLRPILRRADYFALSFGSIVGVGWLIQSGDWLGRGGPAGSIIAFLGCTLALIPVAIVYAGLIERFPSAGAEIAYLPHGTPGDLTFLAGWIVSLGYVAVCPWEAVVIGELLEQIHPIAATSVHVPGTSMVLQPFKILAGAGALWLVWWLNCRRGIGDSGRFQRVASWTLLGLFAGLVVLALANGSLDKATPWFNEHAGILGVRVSQLDRYELEREERIVEVTGGTVRIKVGVLDGRVVNLAPEHDDCTAVAEATGRSVKSIWAEALARAHTP